MECKCVRCQRDYGIAGKLNWSKGNLWNIGICNSYINYIITFGHVDFTLVQASFENKLSLIFIRRKHAYHKLINQSNKGFLHFT